MITMHEDILKLIDIAKESGELTETQRSIILRKAKSLGEDIDEIEMLLETIKPNVKKRTAPQKCPHCGSVIPALSLKCPDCGFLFEDESQSTQEARATILNLQKELSKYDDSGESEEIKAALIQGASIPKTIEGLSQWLTFASSKYSSTGHNSNSLRALEKNAWLAKAKDAYSQLQLRANADPSVQSLLNSYAYIMNAKPAKEKWLLYSFAVLALMALMLLMMKYLG